MFPCLYCHQPVYEQVLSEGLDGEGGGGGGGGDYENQ